MIKNVAFMPGNFRRLGYLQIIGGFVVKSLGLNLILICLVSLLSGKLLNKIPAKQFFELL